MLLGLTYLQVDKLIQPSIMSTLSVDNLTFTMIHLIAFLSPLLTFSQLSHFTSYKISNMIIIKEEEFITLAHCVFFCTGNEKNKLSQSSILNAYDIPIIYLYTWKGPEKTNIQQQYSFHA